MADLLGHDIEHEQGPVESSAASPEPAASKMHSSGLRALYQRYFIKLVNDLRSTYGPGPPDPDDVAHAAFEKLSQRGRLDDIANPESYVWIAARNIIMSAKRAERVRFNNQDELERRWPGQPGDSFDPERVLIAEEQLDLIINALNRMPERRQRIFILNRVDGLTPQQAGAACGVSRTAAVRHIALATDAIAEALSENSNTSLKADA